MTAEGARTAEEMRGRSIRLGNGKAYKWRRSRERLVSNSEGIRWSKERPGSSSEGGLLLVLDGDILAGELFAVDGGENVEADALFVSTDDYEKMHKAIEKSITYKPDRMPSEIFSVVLALCSWPAFLVPNWTALSRASCCWPPAGGAAFCSGADIMKGLCGR